MLHGAAITGDSALTTALKYIRAACIKKRRAFTTPARILWASIAYILLTSKDTYKEMIMKKPYQFIFTVLASALFLSTTHAEDNTAVMLDTLKHLKEKDAKILMTINKDHSASAINANTGQVIKPCRTDIPKNKSLADLESEIIECLPKGHKKMIGKVITRGEYMMWKGSDCYAGVKDIDLYVFCSPPIDFGF